MKDSIIVMALIIALLALSSSGSAQFGKLDGVLGKAKQARCQHSIKDGAGDKPVMLFQEPQIVVGSVHD